MTPTMTLDTFEKMLFEQPAHLRQAIETALKNEAKHGRDFLGNSNDVGLHMFFCSTICLSRLEAPLEETSSAKAKELLALAALVKKEADEAFTAIEKEAGDLMDRGFQQAFKAAFLYCDKSRERIVEFLTFQAQLEMWAEENIYKAQLESIVEAAQFDLHRFLISQLMHPWASKESKICNIELEQIKLIKAKVSFLGPISYKLAHSRGGTQGEGGVFSAGFHRRLEDGSSEIGLKIYRPEDGAPWQVYYVLVHEFVHAVQVKLDALDTFCGQPLLEAITVWTAQAVVKANFSNRCALAGAPTNFEAFLAWDKSYQDVREALIGIMANFDKVHTHELIAVTLSTGVTIAERLHKKLTKIDGLKGLASALYKKIPLRR